METLRDNQKPLYLAAADNEAALRGTTPRVISAERISVLPNHNELDGLQMAQQTSRHSTVYPAEAAHTIIPCKEVPYNVVKRAFDIVIAFTILVITSPIMLIAAILVRCTSKGPIIFVQERVGRGGKTFSCLKFRSMCADAEKLKADLMQQNELSGPVFKIKNDPRVTPVGRWMRKLSIDELPQLWNVLRGDMSIVGPRPPLPSEVAQYTVHQQQRLAVRPGLTCLWQINGRSNVDFDRWVELDLAYIENMSFITDVKIVLQTIPAVLFGRGAH